MEELMAATSSARTRMVAIRIMALTMAGLLLLAPRPAQAKTVCQSKTVNVWNHTTGSYDLGTQTVCEEYSDVPYDSSNSGISNGSSSGSSSGAWNAGLWATVLGGAGLIAGGMITAVGAGNNSSGLVATGVVLDVTGVVALIAGILVMSNNPP
jgi:hypothetical protein